jgi:signal transduction histidine kinase
MPLAPPPAQSPPDPAGLRHAYRDEVAATLRRRFFLGAVLYLSAAAAAVVLEYQHHGTRGDIRLHYWFAEVAVWIAGSVALAVRRLRPWTTAVVSLVTALVVVLLLRYNLTVGAPAERCVMFQVCLVTAVVVLMPWGWRPQLFVAATSLIGFHLIAPGLPASDALQYAVVGLFSAAVTSVWGAFFLDRYRHEAFSRAALLTRASAAQQEETEIAAALLGVAQTLDANLGAPDMLERVNELARDTVGTDMAGVYIWNEDAAAFRLQTSSGVPPVVLDEIGGIDFTADSLPIVGALRGGEHIEVTAPEGQDLIPADLMRRWQFSSALYTPLVRRGETLGLVVYAYGERTGAFSSKQRRLATGIAHATAIALQNARLIADLQAASRLKSDFVATMSHELRTPLNVITGYTELIAEGAFGELPAEMADTVGRIRRSAMELIDLVNATLDLGRLEAGRDGATIAPVDLGDLLAEIRHELETLVAPGVQLGSDDTGVPAPVLTDRVKLKTIVKNLVGNALKFTPRGRVAVTALVDEGELIVQVADTGIGIPAEGLPVIFDMFRQLDGSHTRRYGGVGLGLYIVRRLTSLLGGRVDVQSAPGAGSTFTVRIPVRLAPLVSRPAVASSAGTPAGS